MKKKKTRKNTSLGAQQNDSFAKKKVQKKRGTKLRNGARKLFSLVTFFPLKSFFFPLKMRQSSPSRYFASLLCPFIWDQSNIIGILFACFFLFLSNPIRFSFQREKWRGNFLLSEWKETRNWWDHKSENNDWPRSASVALAAAAPRQSRHENWKEKKNVWKKTHIPKSHEK